MTIERALVATTDNNGSAVYVEDVFAVKTYTGNGTARSITNGIDLSGKGGLVWIKDRTEGYNHCLFDTVRAAGYSLHSNTSDGQSYDANSITAFSSTGFSIGTGNTSNNQVNSNNVNFASWTFRKQEKFFDVVSYTGNGSTNTLNHNLGCVPGMIIIKRVDAADMWYVYHKGIGYNYNLYLNDSGAKSANSGYGITNVTSTSMTMSFTNEINGPGRQFIAYLFADSNSGGFGASGNDSVVACGSVTTDSNGFFSNVNIGFEPQFIIFKTASAGGYWYMLDTTRGWSATPGGDAALYPNNINTEGASNAVDPTSTGFENPSTNFGSNVTIIYLAIRKNMK